MASRTLEVRITGDPNHLAGAFRKAGAESQTFGSRLRGGAASGLGALAKAGGLAALGIGVGLAAALKVGVSEFGIHQQAAAQTRAALKSTGNSANTTAGSIIALADSIEKKSGMDDIAIQSGANLLLTFCLEESAEALTLDRGWVCHEDLSEGDFILAYDPVDDGVKWEMVDSMHRFQVDGELTRWRSKQIDVATTPHHRWWTTGRTCDRDRASTMQDYQFRTTEEVSGHQFAVKIGGGQPACFADDPTYSDDLVELAAWVFTEGWFPRWKDQTGRSAHRKERLGLPAIRTCSRCSERPAAGGRGPAVCVECRTPKSQLQAERRAVAVRTITPAKPIEHYSVGFCQSETANPETTTRIRLLVDRLRQDGHRVSETSSTAAYNDSTIVQWHFARDLGKAIRGLLPEKKLSPALFGKMTESQARMFLEVLILADGHTDSEGHSQFIQKDAEQLGLVAMLAAMLGIRTTLLGRGDGLYFCATNHAWGINLNAHQEAYNGVVWCPHLRTGIFLARCNGKTFWTGNTNVRNEAGKGNDVFNQATRTIADMSTALGQDTKSSAMQLGKALNDPIKGITALQRVGVSFTAGQKDQIKAMVASGDVMGAQKIILGELNKEFGGSAEAAGKTLPGQLNILKARLSEVAQGIAEKLIPVLTQVVNWVSAHWPQISAVVTTVMSVITNVIGTAVGFIRAHWGQIQAAAASVMAWYRANVAPTIAAVSTAVKAVLAGLAAFWDRWGAQIMGIVRTALNLIKNVIQTVLAVIRGDWSTAWNGIKAIVTGALSLIGQVLLLAVSTFGALASKIGHAVVDKIKDGLSALGSAVRDKLGDAKDALLAMPGQVGGFALSIGRRIVDGILSGVGGLYGRLKSKLESDLKSVLSSLNPFSPVEHGGEMFIGRPLVEGAVKGISDARSLLAGSLDTTIRASVTGLNVPNLSGGGGGDIVFHQTPAEADPQAIAAAVGWARRTVSTA